MTKMTIVDVVNIVYPGQFALGNVAFGQDGNGPIFITKWTVPNEPEPSVQSLEQMIPALQSQFDFQYFVSNGTPLIASHIDSVAQGRSYDSAISCASYINSTVPQWAQESAVFIAWRDSVYAYAYDVMDKVSHGLIPCPTFDEFMTGVPAIQWPQINQ